MLHREKVAVWAEINAKHINALWAECTVFECQTRRCIKWPVGFERLLLISTSRYCMCLLWLLSEVSVHNFITVRQNQTGRLTAQKANTWHAGIITDFVYTNICCHLIMKEFKTHNCFVRQIFSIDYVPTLKAGKCNFLYKEGTTRGAKYYLADYFGPTNTVQFKNPSLKANYCSINCFQNRVWTTNWGTV